MRHVLSLVAGMVVAPVVWLLVAVGQGATQNGLADAPTTSQELVGGVMLLAIGLVAGLIATLRTSPLGAIIVGLVFVGASAYLYLDPAEAANLFDRSTTAGPFTIDLMAPLTSGVLGFTGGLLLVSAFSAARWRGAAPEPDADWSPIPREDSWRSPEDRWPPQPAQEGNWSYGYQQTMTDAHR